MHGVDADGPVTLKCSRQNEAMIYTEVDSMWDAFVQLDKWCREVPIHLIFGADDTLM